MMGYRNGIIGTAAAFFAFKKLSEGEQEDFPARPEFFEDPRFTTGLSNIFSESESLRNLDFSGRPDLAATTQLDPEITGLALQQAQGALLPAFQRQRQDTINQLANLGALQSSTTADALAQAELGLTSQFQSITAGAALEDRSRALENRIRLFGTGLNLLESGTNIAGTSQAERNTFNLRNFENEVGAFLFDQGNKKGGITGALTGALGGGLAGFAVGGPAGALIGAGIGGVAGGFGPAGTGGQFLGAGSSFAGSYQFGGGLRGNVTPGSTAGVGNLLAKRPSFQQSGFSLFSNN